jgi:flagellar biosynthesis protein FlhF
MQLKRYRMPTVQEALALARLELGPDALVLSTRLVSRAGVSGWLGNREVEVTAATDRNVSEDRPPMQPRRQGGQEPDLREGTIARLCASGLERSLASEIADAVPGDRRRGASLKNLRLALAERLGSMATGDEPGSPIEVFVGPPGVGKTTTIAKIAARERARKGKRLGLVAADGFRVGAIEQLRLYADIIGSPFTVARSAPDLDKALRGRRTSVLVDTAGRSPGDPSAREFYDVLGAHPNVRTHLVIAAGTPSRDVARICERYKVARPNRVVLTKLDETESLAPLVGVLREFDLPISYLGTGQRVPEDLERATAAALSARVLG